jgi:hypothetical protein
MCVPLFRPVALSAACLVLSACSGHSGSTLAQIEAAAVNAPLIHAAPQTLAVHEGDPAMFQVASTGTEPVMYQWQRDGQPIAGATGASYRLPATSVADHGAVFRVIVINEYGAVVSDVGSLSVAGHRGAWAWE